MHRFISNARFSAMLAVAAILLAAGIVSGAAGSALIIGGANQAGTSNTSLNTTSTGFAWQMNQQGSGVGVYAISNSGNALAALAHSGNKYALSATNDGTAGTGAAVIADGRNNTALDLRVNSSSIDPLKVNSTALVENLNVDLLDGWHANGVNRVAYVGDDFVVDGDAATTGRITTTITAPGRGWLTISGSSYVFNETLDGTDNANCWLEVNNSEVLGSNRWVDTQWNATVKIDEVNCAVDGGYKVCSSGTYTVDMEFASIGPDLNVEDAALTVEYVPFDGAGNLPSIFTCPIIILEHQADEGARAK